MDNLSQANGPVKLGLAQAIVTATGRQTGFRIEAWHNGLNEYRLLRAPDRATLQNKLNIQLAAWNEKWVRVSAKNAAEETRLQGKEDAEARTNEAQDALTEASQLLSDSVRKAHVIHWEGLENHDSFRFTHIEKFPGVEFEKSSGRPLRAVYTDIPGGPSPQDAEFQPKLDFFDRLIASRRHKKEQDASSKFEAAYQAWQKDRLAVEEKNSEATRHFQAAQIVFARAAQLYEASQREENAKIQGLKQRYLSRDSVAVTLNAEMVLDASTYPHWMTTNYSVNYNPVNQILIVDYQLPQREALPNLAKVTYVASRNEFKESFLSDADQNRLFDTVLYQLALRSIHELFDADAAGAVESVVFNGWLTWTNPATGKEEKGCLLTLQANKSEFQQIDLAKVDPKACFKQLKGISAAKLSGLTPVAPIIQFDKNDPRFVASHEVVDYIDSGTNLAAIDWEEFEHLVRELFEKEFATDGADVKVTRASADGGVDAVVFDPDPIRGGKIVIQAKRYTNTVGVSAVRDLYGTMLNEGAMKGILVTTSDYGSDSYTFAKDKPITLLNGGNLLSLLEKHGHPARIDIAEARRLRESNSPNGRQQLS
jgi:restriction system protein